MPAKQSEFRSTQQALLSLAEGLKNAARRPSIHGYKPHSKQEKFHNSDAKIRLFIGGNRSGKTVGGAVECVRLAIGEHPVLSTKFPPPCRIRIVCVDIEDGINKITKPEVARWCPLSELEGDSWETAYNKQSRTLTFKNGSFIEWLTYEQDTDKHAGTSRHLIWMDEEPPQAIYEENLLRLLDVGGHLVITMTPVEGMTWTHDDIYLAGKSGENPNIFVVEVHTEENPHINAAEIDALLSGLSEDQKSARLKGKFVATGGLIYDEFDPEIHIIDPFDPPKDWLHVASLDHGFTNPTAWLWGAVDREGRIFIFDEYYQTKKVISEHAAMVHQINQAHDRVPSYYVGDPSIRNIDPITGTSVLLEYIDYGVPIVLGNNDVRAGINKIKTYLRADAATGKPKLYITKNCVNLLWEIKRLRWAVWADKKVRRDKNLKEEQHKKDDHACDSLRYLVASRPMYDDGTVVPENTHGLPEPIMDIDNRLDPGTSTSTRSHTEVDDTLGSEF